MARKLMSLIKLSLSISILLLFVRPIKENFSILLKYFSEEFIILEIFGI